MQPGATPAIDDIIQRQVGVSMPFGRVSIVRYLWTGEIDLGGEHQMYRLDYCLSGRPKDARVHFKEHWKSHDYEQIGEVFLLPPGQAMHSKGQSSLASLVCEFDAEAVEKWHDGDLNWTTNRLRGTANVAGRSVRASLQRLVFELKNPGFAHVAACELIGAQIALEIGRALNGDVSDRMAGGLSPWRLRLIDDRLGELGAIPTLEELASLCQLSVRQLTRGFRSSRAISIGAHMSKVRLDRAMELLTGGASVKEVSLSLGFSSASNFSASFRRDVGVTPSQFGQRMRSSRRLVFG